MTQLKTYVFKTPTNSVLIKFARPHPLAENVPIIIALYDKMEVEEGQPDQSCLWGCELWDRWGAVVGQVETSTKSVTGGYAKLLIDRAKVGVNNSLRFRISLTSWRVAMLGV